MILVMDPSESPSLEDCAQCVVRGLDLRKARSQLPPIDRGLRANSTPTAPDVVDRELAKRQDLAYRPARPSRTSPPAPTEGYIAADQTERSRCLSRLLNAPRRPTAQVLIFPVVPRVVGGRSVVISSRRGSSRLGRGARHKVCGPALGLAPRPSGWQPSRRCREEITAAPTSSPKWCRARAEPGVGRGAPRKGVTR
jgi:hypothetical protein